jgi:hypothetical protein
MDGDTSGVSVQLSAHEFLLEILYAHLLAQISTDERERILATLLENAQRATYLAVSAASRSDRRELKGQRDTIELIERFVEQVRKEIANTASK